MNILKRELKAGRKAFILWTIGLFFIMFAGMTKYTGFSNDTSVMAVFDSLPKIVLAVFGMVGVDISTLGGFYAIVVYYGIICVSIYGVALGCNAVNREAIDKTYEFIFTKPCSRSHILILKLITAFFYITLYSILSYIFSVAAIGVLNINNTITKPIALFTISMWLIGVLFCTLSALLATIIKRAEKGILFSNLVFVVTFALGMVYDMLEDGSVLQYLSPLKYFLPDDILLGKLDVMFLVICVILSVIFCFAATKLFERKDLSA